MAWLASRHQRGGRAISVGRRLRSALYPLQALSRLEYGRCQAQDPWSLGGLFARELARVAPDRVRAVVTLGSPFSGDPRQNNVWRLYERVAGHSVVNPPLPRITDKPAVPHLAFWSRRDGIVAPRSARGLDHERDEAVELRCTHMGFGVSVRTVRTVVHEIDRFLKNHA